jgi:hypothetical protein
MKFFLVHSFSCFFAKNHHINFSSHFGYECDTIFGDVDINGAIGVVLHIINTGVLFVFFWQLRVK